MQRNEYGIRLSASAPTRLAGGAHATTLDPARMRGWGPAPGEDSEDAALQHRHGGAEPAHHPARLRAAGRGVVEIVRTWVSRGGEAPGMHPLDAACATVEEGRRIDTPCALPLAARDTVGPGASA